MRIALRTLTLKSKLGVFDKYKEQTVETVLKLDPDYLRWLYYTQSGITFIPEILSKLDITHDRIIPKPGKDIDLFKIVVRSNYAAMDKLEKYKKLAKKRKKERIYYKLKEIRTANNEAKILSAVSLARMNAGNKGSQIRLNHKKDTGK